MNYKAMGSIFLSCFVLFGCAQNTKQVSSNNLQSVTQIKKLEDKVYFLVTVDQELKVDESSEKISHNVALYHGSINLNEEGLVLENGNREIYKEEVKTPYIASKIFDEKGKKEELRTDVLTGISFDIVERESEISKISDKYLIFNVSEVTDWKKVDSKNIYGMDEFIVFPNKMTIQEMILVPVKHLEMSRFFNNDKGRLVVRIVIGANKDFVK